MSVVEDVRRGWEWFQGSLAGEFLPGISYLDVFLSLVILLVGALVVHVLAKGLRRALRRAGVPPLVRRFLVRLTHFLLLVAVVGLALTPLNVDLTSLVIGFGVLGIVVGLALQDTLSNVIAGLLLLILRPFRKGDLVEAGGITGFVEDLSLNATTLKTFDGRKVMIPSKIVWGSPITNFHAWPIRRIDLVVNVSYEDDVQHALRLLRRILEEDPRVLREPAPVTNVRELADSAVNLNVFAWAKQEDFGALRSDLLATIKETFDEEGFRETYPARILHWRGGPAPEP